MTSIARLALPSVFAGLLLAGALSSCANKAKNPPLQWETLPNCRFLPGQYHDGDSFHVKTSN